MKALAITIIILLILFISSVIIEQHSINQEHAQIAGLFKDIFGIGTGMLTFWFIYCIIY